MARTAAIEYDPSSPLVITPHWRRAPCASLEVRAVDLDPDALAKRIDAYFAECYDNGVLPTYCDMAAVTGFVSLIQMMNHARRNPAIMEKVSRGLLAVGAGYEDLTAKGIRTGAFLLERLQGFDPVEPATQKRETFFAREQEVNVNLRGVIQQENVGSDLTPLQAYQQMLPHKTYEQMKVVTDNIAEGDFVEIPDES